MAIFLADPAKRNPTGGAKYERMVRMKREKEKARQILRSISGRHNLRCYTVMQHAIDVSVESYPTQLSMKVLDIEASHRMDKPLSPSAASRALARAAADIWENGCRENLAQIYGHPLDEKPTAQSVIYTVSEYAVQRVTYEIFPIQGIPGDYTIVGREGERSAAIAITAENVETLRQIIELFNDRQLPLDTFLGLYFNGKLPGIK